MTVEPGIYIPEEKLAVRLENDVLITDSGNVDLMAHIPVEADEIDFARCVQVQRLCLGPVEDHFTTWTPLTGRSPLFPQDIDPDDPWQFRNVLVH